MFGFISPLEHEREISRLKDDFEDQLDDVGLQLKRQHKIILASKDDLIAELKGKLLVHERLERTALTLAERERELEEKEHKLELEANLLEIEQDGLEERKESILRDLELHHKKAVEDQEYAETLLEKAKKELDDAESKSRALGRAEGYTDGFKDGIQKPADLIREERKVLQQVVNTSLMTATLGGKTTGTEVDEKTQEAYQKLAQGFADNFATVAAKAVADNKTVIVEK